MNIADMSTRRLKRLFVRTIRSIWILQDILKNGSPEPYSTKADLETMQAQLRHVNAELQRRGWGTSGG